MQQKKEHYTFLWPEKPNMNGVCRIGMYFLL